MLEDLMFAAKEGDTMTVSQLLDGHPELLEASMPNGETPLIAALYYGKIEVVDLLLTRGVAINIHEAAAIGDGEYVAYWLDHDQELIGKYSFDGWTSLHLSAFFGGYEAAEVLLKHGADVNARSTNAMNNQPLHAAVASRKFDLARLLLDHGAQVNACQSSEIAPLHQAVANFDHDLVRLLLDRGADRSIRQAEGKTAFDIALGKGFTDIAELLR